MIFEWGSLFAAVPLALRVWSWLAGVAAWQWEMPLTVRATVALALVGVAGWLDRVQLMRLLRGIRWLLLTLLLLFGWLTPGTAILPYAVPLMPTVEGLKWGAEHALVLIGLVGWLVVWFRWVPVPEQPAALVRAFAWLPRWVPVERFAARLALVLAALDRDASRRVRLTDWQQVATWLTAADER